MLQNQARVVLSGQFRGKVGYQIVDLLDALRAQDGAGGKVAVVAACRSRQGVRHIEGSQCEPGTYRLHEHLEIFPVFISSRFLQAALDSVHRPPPDYDTRRNPA